MLNRLNDLSSRAAKILLNWLAVLVGMDLPPAMQTGLRTLAARHEKEVQVRCGRRQRRRCPAHSDVCTPPPLDALCRRASATCWLKRR